MNVKSPIIEKIKKLLALANSSNEHEAALAASHAQRLLSEHNLAMIDIEATHKPDKADTVEINLSKTLPKWLRHLSAGVSTAFDCQAVHHPATGKISTINARLRAQKVETPITTGALVVVKEGLIRQAMNEFGNLKSVKSRRSYINGDAYTKGQSDGKQVGIHHGIGFGEKPQKIIGH
jgi:Protein of unknown function (DUF2786)